MDSLYSGSSYPVFGGPLIVLPETDPQGFTRVSWQVTANVAVQQPLAFLVVATLRSSENMSQTLRDPNFPLGSFAQYMMAATLPKYRLLVRNAP